MLHITCHYYNFVIIYTACVAHLNAHYIHLNTCSSNNILLLRLEACVSIFGME